MNKDRELLELAAKAAGLRFAVNGDGLPGYISVNSDDWRHGWCYWNPLVDDGTALRLLAKLKTVTLTIGPGRAEVLKGKLFIDELTSGSEQKHGDSMLYIRRAIVRAAAEIGRSL